MVCPYCGSISSRTHSVYQREIQDIPMQDKQTILLLNIRKMFCVNQECAQKTFSERFEFISLNGKKTKRLIDKILDTSTKLSSVNASALLNNSSIQISKSSICDLLKKYQGLWIKLPLQKYVWMILYFAKDKTMKQLWLTSKLTELLIYLIHGEKSRSRND